MEGTGRELPVQVLCHGQERKVDRFRQGRTDSLKFQSGKKLLLLILSEDQAVGKNEGMTAPVSPLMLKSGEL